METSESIYASRDEIDMLKNDKALLVEIISDYKIDIQSQQQLIEKSKTAYESLQSKYEKEIQRRKSQFIDYKAKINILEEQI